MNALRFKNIQYKIQGVASEKCPDLVGQYGISGISLFINTEDFIFAFTFTWVNGDNEIEDVLVSGQVMTKNNKF